MTEKYIPGPWRIAQYDFDRGAAIIETVELGSDVPDPIGYYVATVSAADEQDPTARLIAAAPELLEALKDCYAELNQLAFLAGDKLAHITLDKAAAAIRKATPAE